MTDSRSPGSRVVTSDAIAGFADLTGDRSRIHVDSTFARANGFGGPIAHGLLTGAWALGALAQHAPSRLGIGMHDSIVSQFSLKLSRVVETADALTFRFACAAGSRELAGVRTQRTSFEVSNQRSEVVASGDVTVCIDGRAYLEARHSLRIDPIVEAAAFERDAARVYFAEDIVEDGPRGTTRLRDTSAEMVREYVELSGERNPVYSDRVFAAQSCCESQIVPAMLIFCLAFSEFLRALLRVELPAAGSAGHVADEWSVHRPVVHGETLRVVHRALDHRKSTSRPELSVVRFGLQIIDINCEVVQSGVVTMMIPARPRQ